MLPETELVQAARELGGLPLRDGALRRAEDAILLRAARRSRLVPLVWAGGFAATAALVAFGLAAPRKASAAELLQIARNGATGLRRVRNYEIAPDGTRRLVVEIYAEGPYRRMNWPGGSQSVYDGARVTRLFPDGAVTVETAPLGEAWAMTPESGEDIMRRNLEGGESRLTVRRGAVDRYEAEYDWIDGRGRTIRSHFVLEADPRTRRPLTMRSRSSEYGESLILFDEPAPSPDLFRLPIPPGARVDDFDAQRAAVLASIRKPIHRTVVAGQPVALGGFWMGDDGGAYAVVLTEGVLPSNLPFGIDRPFAMTEAQIRERRTLRAPSHVEGRAVHLLQSSEFWKYPRPKAVFLPDKKRATLEIPVFRGRSLVGIARFRDVTVQRTWSTGFLLQPENRPFWEIGPVGPGEPVQAVESSPEPNR